MRNLKLTIQYDGASYRGWQKLGDSDKTIQGKIEEVLKKMTNEDISLIGSGRTDAGAHAEKQVANFKTECTLSEKAILEYCNNYLPRDILIRSVTEASENFHSRYNAKSKIYVYKLSTKKLPDVFKRRYVYSLQHSLSISKMRTASEILIGEHDFQSFTTLKSKTKSTVRTISRIDIIENGDYIDLIFEGNGFLHNMVRILTGTLIEIGEGKLTIEQLDEILIKKDRSLAGYTIPPQGLFLVDVKY